VLGSRLVRLQYKASAQLTQASVQDKSLEALGFSPCSLDAGGPARVPEQLT